MARNSIPHGSHQSREIWAGFDEFITNRMGLNQYDADAEYESGREDAQRVLAGKDPFFDVVPNDDYRRGFTEAALEEAN